MRQHYGSTLKLGLGIDLSLGSSSPGIELNPTTYTTDAEDQFVTDAENQYSGGGDLA